MPSRSMNRRGRLDAISLLTQDHSKVKRLLAALDTTTERAVNRREALLKEIETEIKIHSKVEEEIFYPACREAGVDSDIMNEANVEHDGAKTLIAELESGSPDDEFYDAKVKVLSEEIKHHVNEEEKRDGILAKAKSSGLDVDQIGQRLSQRKAELMARITV